MEKDPNYFFQLFDLAWEAAEKGVVVIDLLIAFALVCVFRYLEKKNKFPTVLSSIPKHPFFEDDKWRLLIVFGIIFIMQMVFVSPYSLYKKNRSEISELKKLADDRSPKLEGFFNRTMIADEVGTTNSLVFVEVSVSNSGGTPSRAEEYELKVNLSKGASTNAEPIKFSNEYKLNFSDKGKQWLLDLKRSQLISEKTIKAVSVGESSRGWLAFRIRGMSSSKFQQTNLVLSFIDNNGKKIAATNGFWRGKQSSIKPFDDLTTIIPGAENIFYPVEPPAQAGWMPPELPPGCSNVVVFFGASGMNYTRIMAEIAPEGTRFAIKDLPDFYLQNLDKSPSYSPRQKYMWIKSGTSYSIGGKTFPYPIQPIIISNRLYVQVDIPFLNEKRKIVMSDDFDPELPIPSNWDRNYSTNYYADGVVSGGIYAYEVVNELTNPVLQVFYSAPNEVHINGIFKVDENSIFESFGEQPMLLTFSNRIFEGVESTQRITTVSLMGTNFSETLHFYTNDSIGSIGEIITNEFYRPIFPHQRAAFKYPSNRHLGEFDGWILETNKSDTN